MNTFASLFSGGGGADIGALQAGFQPIWGIEIEQMVGEVYTANLKHQPLIKSITQINPKNLEKPDILWASPPCQAFSIAKNKKLAPRSDTDIGLAIIPFIEVLRPQVFILENVEGYRYCKIFYAIIDTLHRCGYWTQWEVLNAADFGVPQTRRRLILRAVKDSFVPSLPQPQNWRGWYAAITDLIPCLRPTQLAPWQLKRLPSGLLDDFLIDSKNADFNGSPTVRAKSEPIFTICAAIAKGLPKAVLLERSGARNGNLNLRLAQQPVWTIKSSITTDGKGSDRNAFINALVEGQVLSLNIRSLARLQTFPDWYTFPKSTALAGRIIGNAVPPLMAKSLILNTVPC